MAVPAIVISVVLFVVALVIGVGFGIYMTRKFTVARHTSELTAARALRDITVVQHELPAAEQTTSVRALSLNVDCSGDGLHTAARPQQADSPTLDMKRTATRDILDIYRTASALSLQLDEAESRPASRMLSAPSTPLVDRNSVEPTSLHPACGIEVHMHEIENFEQVGKGAFGAVYKGTWRGAPVAIKYVVCNTADQEATRRSVQEVVLSKKMSHPNVVQSYAWTVIAAPGVTDGDEEPELNIVKQALSKQNGLNNTLNRTGERKNSLCGSHQRLVIKDSHQQSPRADLRSASSALNSPRISCSANGTPAFSPPTIIIPSDVLGKKDVSHSRPVGAIKAIHRTSSAQGRLSHSQQSEVGDLSLLKRQPADETSLHASSDGSLAGPENMHELQHLPSSVQFDVPVLGSPSELISHALRKSLSNMEEVTDGITSSPHRLGSPSWPLPGTSGTDGYGSTRGYTDRLGSGAASVDTISGLPSCGLLADLDLSGPEPGPVTQGVLGGSLRQQSGLQQRGLVTRPPGRLSFESSARSSQQGSQMSQPVGATSGQMQPALADRDAPARLSTALPDSSTQFSRASEISSGNPAALLPSAACASSSSMRLPPPRWQQLPTGAAVVNQTCAVLLPQQHAAARHEPAIPSHMDGASMHHFAEPSHSAIFSSVPAPPRPPIMSPFGAPAVQACCLTAASMDAAPTGGSQHTSHASLENFDCPASPMISPFKIPRRRPRRAGGAARRNISEMLSGAATPQTQTIDLPKAPVISLCPNPAVVVQQHPGCPPTGGTYVSGTSVCGTGSAPAGVGAQPVSRQHSKDATPSQPEGDKPGRRRTLEQPARTERRITPERRMADTELELQASGHSYTSFNSEEGFGSPMTRGHHRSQNSLPELENLGKLHDEQAVVVVVMEYCDLGSLQRAINKKAFRPHAKWSFHTVYRALLRTAQEIAKGMDYTHSFGIIHGDLKPGNVLLKTHRIDRRGYIAKVSDFGLSWPLLDSEKHVSVGNNIGTISYCAPEVLMNSSVCKASDVYAFGILLWEMFYCKTVYAGLMEAQIFMGVGDGSLRPEFDDGCPRPYRDLAVACWQQDLALRPTFAMVAKRLTDIEVDFRMQCHRQAELLKAQARHITPHAAVPSTPQAAQAKASMPPLQRVGSSPQPDSFAVDEHINPISPGGPLISPFSRASLQPFPSGRLASSGSTGLARIDS